MERVFWKQLIITSTVTKVCKQIFIAHGNINYTCEPSPGRPAPGNSFLSTKWLEFSIFPQILYVTNLNLVTGWLTRMYVAIRSVNRGKMANAASNETHLRLIIMLLLRSYTCEKMYLSTSDLWGFLRNLKNEENNKILKECRKSYFILK